MALVVKDRVKVTTATTGTGTLTLGSAVAGFQAFSAVLSNADTTYYAIFESSTGAWEVGLGTYASPANTLARTTILESSNAGSAINLTAGNADVFITQPAEKAVYLDASGYIFTADGRNLTNLNATSLTSGTVNDARLPATISSDITGNAATATKWATGRTISLTGDVTGTSGAFDGSGNLSFATTIAANSVALGTDTTGNYVATIATNAGLDGSGSSEGAAVTLSLNLNELTTSTANGDGDYFVVVDTVGTQRKLTKGNINISGFNNDAGYTTNVGDITGVTAGTYITGGGTSGTVTVNVDATSANTASKVVARDASGNFSAGTITAALSGNASTASALQTARNIALTGAVTGNANFDGSGNISISTTATSDPTLTLSGDATGSATFTNLGNATLTVTVVDDSHNHIISNVDGLQTALDGKFSTSGGTISGNVTVDNGTSTVIDVVSDDTGTSGIRLYGASQGTGYVEVGQSTTYGGGMSYNGDGSPPFASGETADNITFYRLENGTRTEVFHYPYNSNIVNFNATPTVGGNVVWNAGNDGSGSGLDADTTDGYHVSTTRNAANTIPVRDASGYLQLGWINTTSGATTSTINKIYASYDDYIRYVTPATLISQLGIWTSGNDGAGSGLDADLWDGNQFSSYLNQAVLTSSSPTFANAYIGDYLYHSGDTDTRLQFGTNTITLTTGGSSEITVNTTGVRLGDTGNGYFQPVSGSYGSIQIDGGAHNGWEGYSIGGRAVFMHDNSNSLGLYDDANNKWAFRHTFNGTSELYYNGSSKLQTTSSGINVTGTAEVDTLSFSDGSSQTSAGASTGKAIAMAIVFG